MKSNYVNKAILPIVARIYVLPTKFGNCIVFVFNSCVFNEIYKLFQKKVKWPMQDFMCKSRGNST